MGLSTGQAQSQNILHMKHVTGGSRKPSGLGVLWGEDCDPSLCPCRDGPVGMFWEGSTSRRHPCVSQGGAEQQEGDVQGCHLPLRRSTPCALRVCASSACKAPSYTPLCSACPWKTQGSPLKMFHPAHRSVSMSWSVWLHSAGLMRQNK